jgi:CheY-like chemotaxis protein
MALKRKSICTQLLVLGWEEIAEAEDGIDAIRKARATKPDVAVLDCMMPLMNGVEATKADPRSRARDGGLSLHAARR